MKLNRTNMIATFMALALLTSACGMLQIELESAGDEATQLADSIALPTKILSSSDIQPAATEEGTSTDAATKRYVFEELGISLEVPADLYVKKEPIVSLNDSSKLESYLFYIQNYGQPGGSPSGDFQMYGSLQYGPFMTVSWEEFSNNTINSPMNAYANYIEIDGLKGYDTQLSGVRNRFVYLFHIDGHVLSIAVSDPTLENKASADQIINTLKVIPGEFSDASHVQSILEPNLLYQLLIPEDWDYTFKPTAGIRISDFEASSPNAEVVAEDIEGPHSNIYYKNGVFMNLVVLEDDSARYKPNMASISMQYSVYFNGIEGTEYIFTEPSTAEGELREARIFYDGKSYILRFGYADDVYRDAIDRIIGSLQLSE
jgi:hypothetical protein